MPGHDQSGRQKQMKVAGVAGAADGAAKAGSFNNFPLKMKVFGDDAGVPSAARRGDHSCDEIGENSWKNQVAPAIETSEIEKRERPPSGPWEWPWHRR